MRSAGVEMDAYQELYHRMLSKKVKFPATVTCSYFLSDKPVDVQITVLGEKNFRIEVADDGIAKKIRKEVLRYTAAGKPASKIAEAEDKALDARIEKILKRDGVTTEDVEVNKVTLSRRAQEEFMRLCEEVRHTERGSVYGHFTKCQIPREDRLFVARWLLKRFAVEKDPGVRRDVSMVFLNHSDLIRRELAEDVIRLVKDSHYGTSRSGMIYVLAKTKHPQAAEIIASVMDQGRLAWSGLRCLGVLKARQHEAQIRNYLRHTDSEVRLEAKRALKKIGALMEQAPSPVHLVKNRKSLPKGLEEWSANLDFENLEPALKTLSACVDKGFGAQEIAEVIGVAEETRPEQTKAFRFPITAKSQADELWIIIFMDDIDSPDLEIHASNMVIKKFETAVDLKG